MTSFSSIPKPHYSLRQHDAAVFRDLNERLLEAVRGEPQFEAALSFPRAADEDRADRLADFEHLQVCHYSVFDCVHYNSSILATLKS